MKSKMVFLTRSHLSAKSISPSLSIIKLWLQLFLVAELRLQALGYFISRNFVEIIRQLTATSWSSARVIFAHLEVNRSIIMTQWWMVPCLIERASPTLLIQSTSCFLFYLVILYRDNVTSKYRECGFNSKMVCSDFCLMAYTIVIIGVSSLNSFPFSLTPFNSIPCF